MTLSADDITKIFKDSPTQVGAVFISGQLEPHILPGLALEGFSSIPAWSDGGQYILNSAALEAQTQAGDKIYKYPLPFNVRPGIHRLLLPEPSSVVLVRMQGGVIHLWVRVGQGDPRPRFFQIVGTGQPFPASAPHIGSVQDGGYVWHVLERTDVVDVVVRDAPAAE